MSEIMREVIQNIGHVIEQKISKFSDTLDKIASRLDEQSKRISKAEQQVSNVENQPLCEMEKRWAWLRRWTMQKTEANGTI